MNTTEYILHTTPQANIDKIHKKWFNYKEWYPTVSWSLVFSVNHANKQWYKEKPDTKDQLRKILIMKKPKDKYIKPWYKWTINIQKKEWKIRGNTTIRAANKMESWIYDKDNVLKLTPYNFKSFSKKELYNFVKNNNLNKEKNIPMDIIMTLTPTETLSMISRELRKKVWNLQKIDFDLYVQKISKELSKKEHIIHDKTISLEQIAKDLLYSTLEQEVVNFIRNLYLMTMEYKWYDIYKNEDKISLLERKEYKESFNNFKILKEIVNKPNFDLTWFKDLERLNRYLKIFINKLYEEKVNISILEWVSKIKKVFKK